MPIETLKPLWHSDSLVLYIGKAGSLNSGATLRSRLRQYMRFGQGKNIGHYGGRYIWQIKDCGNLVVCWKTLKDDDPDRIESMLIQMFRESFGRRPFANLVK